MTYKIGFESMGGNAGMYANQNCSALNFRYDSDSGLIGAFENFTTNRQRDYCGIAEGAFILSNPNLISRTNHGIVKVFLQEDICSAILFDSAMLYNYVIADEVTVPELIIEKK